MQQCAAEPFPGRRRFDTQDGRRLLTRQAFEDMQQDDFTVLLTQQIDRVAEPIGRFFGADLAARRVDLC